MMNKRLLLLCLLISGTRLSAAQDGGNGESRIALTQAEILSELPKGIINPLPRAVEWKNDNEIILIQRGTESGKMERSVYDLKSGAILPFGEDLSNHIDEEAALADSLNGVLKSAYGAEKIGKCLNLTFSPDFSEVAYTFDNDIYVYSFKTGKEIRVTERENKYILNGYASWVYYEEILGRPSKYKAFWWSPDSDKIAYYRFDESGVRMFPIYDSRGQYGSVTETYYPKAGCENPKVNVMIANLNGIDSDSSSEITFSEADFDAGDDQYFGIPFWNEDTFFLPWMPRDQNRLILYSLKADGSKSLPKTPVYSEEQGTWIDWIEDMHFTPSGFYMVRDFELWEQIYYQSFDGKVLKRITDGKNWGVNILSVDEKKGEIFFTARRDASTRNDLYKVNIKNGKIVKLSQGAYNYGSVILSPDRKHFVAVRSNVSVPSQLVLGRTDAKGEIAVLFDSKGEKFDEYKLALPEMLQIEVDGYLLPARVIWPVDLDSTKKYPVLVSMYGGPNAGTVMDTWQGVDESTQWWAYEGVIQISIDHRASGHCGKEGLNYLHRNLLTIELHDYIEWIKELYKRPFVNREKVGITGFSYGGSMTVLAVTEGNEYFKYGIAGGGVYDYSLYDTHYTERYMDTPQSNPEGYKNTRLMDKIEKYRGDSTNFVKITHGTADDNVHMQNTLQLIDALQEAGKQFELMIYPGEYHGYRGNKSIHSNRGDYIFWYRHLLDREAPEIILNGDIKHR